MTEPLCLNHSASSVEPASLTPGIESSRSSRWARTQLGVCIAICCGLLVLLMWPENNRAASPPREQAALRTTAVWSTKTGRVHIEPGSPLVRKLEIVRVNSQTTTNAVLSVTGRIAASLRPDRGGGRSWQFESPDLLTTYADWQKSFTDIAFANAQVASFTKLADTRQAAQQAAIARLRRLVEAGTETQRDLATAETELIQSQIEAQKELHEANTALRLAQRAEVALRQQLEHAGIDAELLRVTGKDIDVVVADVPEALLSRVKVGQQCEAKFLAVGPRQFVGQVRSISPVLSRERGSIRVFFTIDDPEDLLRPGMFADVGLGTDERGVVLVPLAGVVHIGRSDYLLIRAEDGDWRVAAVQVGEVHDTLVEILDGVKDGDKVLGQGAILLKPAMLETLQRPQVPALGGS